MRHEREGLGVPQVTVVNTGHEDVGQEDTDVLVDLEPDRVVQAWRTNQVPVEAPREETHALVVASATEDVAEHLVGVVGQTENRNTSQDGEDP